MKLTLKLTVGLKSKQKPQSKKTNNQKRKPKKRTNKLAKRAKPNQIHLENLLKLHRMSHNQRYISLKAKLEKLGFTDNFDKSSTGLVTRLLTNFIKVSEVSQIHRKRN